MMTNSRAISIHVKGSEKDRATRLINSQMLGEQINPFVSLEICRHEASAANEFSMSPSLGTAIITFLISGEATYSDSTHKNAILRQNDLVWILSGSGISHSLTPKTSNCVSVKLVIALSPVLEQAPPQSIFLASNLVESAGPAKILLGRYGEARSEFALPALINYLLVTLTAGQSWTYESPVNHSVAWVSVINGKISTSNALILQDETAIYESANKFLSFVAQEDSVFLIGSSVRTTSNLAVKSNHQISPAKAMTNKLTRAFAY